MARLAVLLLGEHPQQVAIVEVEGAEPRRLFGLFQVPVEPAPFRLRRLFPLGAALGQNPPADVLQGIALAKVARKFPAMGPVVGTHRNVLAHLDVIAHLPKVIKKLPFRHRLADGSIHIGFDEGEIGGAAFLLGPPFSIVLGFSPLRVLNDRQPILPAQPVGFPLHGKVVLFAAVILDPVNERHGIE